MNQRLLNIYDTINDNSIIKRPKTLSLECRHHLDIIILFAWLCLCITCKKIKIGQIIEASNV
jgi:hypothetical protein